MRIGLVIYGSLDTLSGGYLYDRQLVRTLRTQGDEVIVLSLPWRSYPRHLLDNWSRRLEQEAQSAHLDLLLQDELNHPSLFWQNRRLRSVLDVPLVSIVHHLRSSEEHPRPLQPLYGATERFYVNSVDGFVFNSATTQATVEALLDRPQPSVVCHPGADHLMPPARATLAALIEQRAQALGPLRIVAVGNVMPRKNLHTLVHAVSRLPVQSWTLNFAGGLTADPAYVAQLKALCHTLGIESQVHFLGAVDGDQLRQLYAASHVMALPSFEGFGIVYLEAMSFGTVPIAATTGAAHEIIHDERCGYLVAPDDKDALARRLLHLQSDRAQWQAMAAAARTRYDRHPSWSASMLQAHRWLHETF